MKQNLISKLNKEDQFTCSDNELTWLINHIGDENAEVRDEIVFNALARAITENGLTNQQFDYLKKETFKRDYINYQINESLPQTLYRTFSALINGFIIQADKDSNSQYFNRLSFNEKNYFFTSSINYLKLEHDYTGYSPVYGWVHGIAHGADFLSKAALHPEFDQENIPEILDIINLIFHKIKTPFVDKEESRLAFIIYQLLLENKLKEIDFIEWLKRSDYPLNELDDYYKLNSFKNFLAAIYFQLESKQQLSNTLKQEFLNYLSEF